MYGQTIPEWLSKVILRTCSDDSKLIYWKFEKLKIRITNEWFHLQFNLACINIYSYITFTASLERVQFEFVQSFPVV